MGGGALLALAAAGAAYVAASMSFLRNYHLTVYAARWRWLLAALWPLLLLGSARFREQFLAAVRGQRPPSPGRGSTRPSVNSNINMSDDKQL